MKINQILNSASSPMAVVAVKWTSVTIYDMYLLREITLPILEMMYLRYFDIYDIISVILYQNIFHVFRLFSISSLNKKLILEFIYHLTTLIIFEKALRQSAQLNI